MTQPFQRATPPSERTFGLSAAALCAALAARLWWRSDLGFALAFLVLAAVVCVVTAAAPGLLSAPNRAWFQLGMALSRIVSPVVVGAMFVLIVTPVGIVMRLFGRDPLRLHERRESYWIAREPPGPAPESFHHQF